MRPISVWHKEMKYNEQKIELIQNNDNGNNNNNNNYNSNMKKKEISKN